MSTLLSTLQVLGSLVGVLLLIVIAARLAANRGLTTGAYPEPFQIRARLGITRGTHVVVVRHGESDLVLGITEHNVTLLKESPAAPEPEPEVAAQPTMMGGAISKSTKSFLDSLREKTVRR